MDHQVWTSALIDTGIKIILILCRNQPADYYTVLFTAQHNERRTLKHVSSIIQSTHPLSCQTFKSGYSYGGSRLESCCLQNIICCRCTSNDYFLRVSLRAILWFMSYFAVRHSWFQFIMTMF